MNLILIFAAALTIFKKLHPVLRCDLFFGYRNVLNLNYYLTCKKFKFMCNKPPNLVFLVQVQLLQRQLTCVCCFNSDVFWTVVYLQQSFAEHVYLICVILHLGSLLCG